MWCIPFTNGGVVLEVLSPDGGRKIMRNVRFSRDGWKAMLVTVIILALILTGMFTLSVRTPAVAKASTPEKSSSAVILVEQKYYAESSHD